MRTDKEIDFPLLALAEHYIFVRVREQDMGHFALLAPISNLDVCVCASVSYVKVRKIDQRRQNMYTQSMVQLY